MADFPDDWHNARYGVCRRCGLKIRDAEPMQQGGEFFHSSNSACQNYNQSFSLGKEIAAFRRKALRREKARGAKLASKMRPIKP